MCVSLAQYKCVFACHCRRHCAPDKRRRHRRRLTHPRVSINRQCVYALLLLLKSLCVWRIAELTVFAFIQPPVRRSRLLLRPHGDTHDDGGGGGGGAGWGVGAVWFRGGPLFGDWELMRMVLRLLLLLVVLMLPLSVEVRHEAWATGVGSSAKQSEGQRIAVNI